MLFTDGGDTRSTIGFGDVMTLMRASDVTVYAVGFLENQSRHRADRAAAAADADRRARAAARRSFRSSMKEIEAAYDKIVAQIRAQYSLGYMSTNTTRDGRWRKVEIKVQPPRLKGLRVQTRKGYFAPYQGESTVERSLGSTHAGRYS